ncbi:hypothetical protein [Streptomyces sp. NPDC005799]|uniref:hypothetical protein n=1 Tax=Streptomyces sp. NPDC005799 TaxID=3154678 RepID=UPI0033D20E7E
MTLYYLVPWDRSSTAAAVGKLVVALAGFAVLVAVQVRSILRSTYPGLRAAEALATSVSFFFRPTAPWTRAWPRCPRSSGTPICTPGRPTTSRCAPQNFVTAVQALIDTVRAKPEREPRPT